MGREVNIPIRVRVKQAINALGKLGAKAQEASLKSKAHFKAARVSANRMGKNVRNAGAGFAAIAGGVLAAVTVIDRFTSAGDNVAKTADKLGAGVEALQEWRYGAERSGMSAQEFDNSLQYLVRSAGEAAAGVGSAKDVFKGLGINVRDANGQLKGGGQLMEEVADKLAGIENPTARATIAYKLFGRSGMGMVNMLKDGSKGLKDYAKEARESGAVIDKETARRAETFQDTFLNIGRYAKGVGVSIMSNLLPGINKIAGSIENWMKGNKDLIATKLTDFLEIAGNVALGFFEGLKGIYNGISAVWEVVKSFIPGLDEMTGNMETWQTVGKVLAGMLGGYLLFALFAATKAVVMFSAALLANPITWVVAAVAALAAAAYLIYDNWEPIAAFFSDLWKSIKAPWEGLVAWFTGLWGRVLAAFDTGGFSAAAFELLTGFLEGLVTGAGAVMVWAWNLPRRILKALLPEDWYNVGSSMLDRLLGGLVSGAGKVLTWAGGLMSRILKALLPESWYNAGADMIGALRDGLASAVDTLTSWMPGWMKEGLGMSEGGGDSDSPASSKAPATKEALEKAATKPAHAPTAIPGPSSRRHGGQGGRVNGVIKVQFEGAPPGTRIVEMQIDTDQDMDLQAGMTTSPGMS